MAESVGDAMTFKVLTDDTNKIIFCSSICSALKEGERNIRLDSFGGEETNKPINEVVKFVQRPNSSTVTPIIHTDDLVGRTFLLDPADDGCRHRAKIIRKIVEHDENLSESMHKFLVSIDAQDSDEIMTYSDIMDYLDRNANSELDEGYWKFKRIISHHGPFKPGDPHHKGSSWNVRLEWEDGSITDEPLDLIS